MSKIHITLVGGQPVPVYHGIVATNPDKIIYIYSSETAKSFNALTTEIHIPYEGVVVSATNPKEILSKAIELAEKYAADDVVVNISSGIKSWTYFFSIVFERMSNAAVIYMDQNNVLWNFRDMDSLKGFNFDSFAVFRLQGSPLENYTDFSEYTQEDIDNIKVIEDLRKSNFDDFKNLTTVLSKAQENTLATKKSGEFTLKGSDSYVQWGVDEVTEKPYVFLCIKNKEHILKKKLESPHIKNLVFNAGWFEVKVASLLKGWSRTKNLYLNCKFKFKDKGNMDMNEVDIIVETGTKFLFVECKTQIHDTTAIDKFSSVIKQYGSIGSKGLFVTDAKMIDLAQKKCKDKKMLAFSVSEANKNASKSLYHLLDCDFLNFNV